MPRRDLIQFRRGTATEWAAANPVMADGEVGWDKTDHGLRTGDGVTPWAGLPTFAGGGGGKGGGLSTAADQFAVDKSIAALNNSFDPTGRWQYKTNGINKFRVEDDHLRQALNNGAGYLSTRLAGTPSSMGLIYDLDAAGTDADGGLIAIVCGDYDPAIFGGTNGDGVMPNVKAIHCSIGVEAWYMQFVDNGPDGVLNLITPWGEFFAEALAPGTGYKVAMELDGRRCRLHLPDGSVKVMEDDRFLSFAGATVTYEAIRRPGAKEPRIARIAASDASVLHQEQPGAIVLATRTIESVGDPRILFDNIPLGYQDLRIRGLLRSNFAGNDNARVSLNEDVTDANYDYNRTVYLGATATTTSSLGAAGSRAVLFVNGSNADVATSFTEIELLVPFYRGAQIKCVRGMSSARVNRLANGQVRSQGTQFWNSVAKIKTIEVGCVGAGGLNPGSYLTLEALPTRVGVPIPPV